jgi:hypothetical protein
MAGQICSTSRRRRRPSDPAVTVNVFADEPTLRRVRGLTGFTLAIENLSPCLNVSPAVAVIVSESRSGSRR